MPRIHYLHLYVIISLIELQNAVKFDRNDPRNYLELSNRNEKMGNTDNIENTITTDREKVIAMCRELLIEIKLKVHQTDGIRNKYGRKNSLMFEVGVMMGQIREKHKTQLELYRQMRDKHEMKEKHHPPENVYGLRPFHFVITLEKIHAKEVEIDNMIEAILRLPQSMVDEAKIPKRPRFLRMEAPAPGVQAAASEDDSDDPEETGVTEKETSEKTLTEEDIKRKYRAEYMKRHNIKEDTPVI